MKTTLPITLLLPLCSLAVLTSCHNPFGGGKSGTDSPIIVSDGSIKYRHKALAENGHKVRVHDSGYAVQTLECPSGKGFNCASTTLLSTWTLTVYDAGSNLIATITSADGKTVDADFGSNAIGPVQADNDSDNPGGQAVETQNASLRFYSFKLVNGDGTIVGPLTCSNNPKPCRIKIHYHN